MASGPRVGGAHVDVDLKFDDKSLNSVGKQIHKQLSSLNKSLAKVGDQNRSFYRAIGRDAVTAWRGLLGAVVTGAPLMGSAISGVAGAATLLAGALNSTVKSSFGLLPIVTSLGLAGLTASIGLDNFGQAINEVNPKRLKQLLEGMPKSMQNAVLATRDLKDEMRAAIWPKLFAGLSDGIESLRDTGVIQRGLGKMADSMNYLARSVLEYANTKQGVKTLNTFFDNNARVFRALSKAAVPFLDGFLRLVNALTPAALRLSNRITDVAKSFQSWTKEAGFAGRMDKMMKNSEKTAGLLFDVIGNLGQAINNIFNIINPSTNTFLEMLVDVTGRFKEFTESASGRNSIAEWAAQSVDVMKQFGRTVGAVFEVIAALADPRVIISFLKTVQEAFEYLNKLPLAKITDAFVRIAETLQPVSSLFLAIIIASAALNVAIGSLIGQVGGLFSIFSKFLQFKILTNILKGTGGAAGGTGAAAAGAAKKVGIFARAWDFILRIFNRLRGAFSSITGLFTKSGAAAGQAASKASLLSRAFKPIMSILGRFVKFAGPVGIAVWIGTIIAKSKDLQAKLGGTWEALKDVFSSLVGAFKEIGTALKPLAPVAKNVGSALGVFFDFLDKIAGFAIGIVIDTITYAFESLANVIKGLGKIIAGFINIWVGIFQRDPSKIIDGLKQALSGVWPLLKGVFGLFVTFFAPARLAKFGLGLVKGLGGGIIKAAPGLLGIVARFLGTVIKFFATLPFRLLKLGGEAIVKLGKAVISKTPVVLAAAGRLVRGFLKWYISLPGRLLRLGLNAIKKLGDAVVKGTPRVLSAARRIADGVIDFIQRLPGSLFDLGKSAISKLGTAFKSGIGALKDLAKSAVTAVVDIIKALPGKLLGFGTELLNAGKTLGGKILEGIRNGISAIGDMAGSVASSLKNGINNAIGLPKSLSFNVLGKKIGFTIPGFAKGGTAPGGLITVGEEGPELLAPPRGSRIYSNRDSKKMTGGGNFPPRAILRIGDKDFIAYIEEIADDRIDAADSLAFQGA